MPTTTNDSFVSGVIVALGYFIRVQRQKAGEAETNMEMVCGRAAMESLFASMATRSEKEAKPDLAVLRPFAVFKWLLTPQEAATSKEWVSVALGSAPKEQPKRSSGLLASSSGEQKRKKNKPADAAAAAAFVGTLFD